MIRNKPLNYLVSFYFSIIICMSFLVNSSQAKGTEYELKKGNEFNIDLTEIVIASLVLSFSYGVSERFKIKK